MRKFLHFIGLNEVVLRDVRQPTLVTASLDNAAISVQ